MNAWPGWAVAPHGVYVHFTREPENLADPGHVRPRDQGGGLTLSRRALCGARVYMVDLRPANGYIASTSKKCPKCLRYAAGTQRPPAT